MGMWSQESVWSLLTAISRGPPLLDGQTSTDPHETWLAIGRGGEVLYPHCISSQWTGEMNRYHLGQTNKGRESLPGADRLSWVMDALEDQDKSPLLEGERADESFTPAPRMFHLRLLLLLL